HALPRRAPAPPANARPAQPAARRRGRHFAPRQDPARPDDGGGGDARGRRRAARQGELGGGARRARGRFEEAMVEHRSRARRGGGGDRPSARPARGSPLLPAAPARPSRLRRRDAMSGPATPRGPRDDPQAPPDGGSTSTAASLPPKAPGAAGDVQAPARLVLSLHHLVKACLLYSDENQAVAALVPPVSVAAGECCALRELPSVRLLFAGQIVFVNRRILKGS